MRERFISFTYERIDCGSNSGTFVGFLAASAEITEEEAKTFLDVEVEAGRLEYGNSEMGTEFVRRPALR